MQKVLVTGGCGYIGSHTIVDLIQTGYEVISIDNFSNSTAETLTQIEAITGQKIKNYDIDLRDRKRLFDVLEQVGSIIGIIHFAALKAVGDSVFQPNLYYDNNLNSLINILEAQKKFQIPYHIFSSSCSVYGNSNELPVTESTPTQRAESPYARTKQMCEDIIQDFTVAHAAHQFVLLRYFNPAGAHDSGLMGESPINTAANLVPVITETAYGLRDQMTVFGTDYDTKDGSCVRDYIHVMDLAHAHTLCLEYLISKKTEKKVELFNVGTGTGVTVLEAIQAFEEVTGKSLKYTIGPRREGDVIAVYANKDKAEQMLGWKSQKTITDIMKTAWDWELKRRK